MYLKFFCDWRRTSQFDLVCLCRAAATHPRPTQSRRDPPNGTRKSSRAFRRASRAENCIHTHIHSYTCLDPRRAAATHPHSSVSARFARRTNASALRAPKKCKPMAVGIHEEPPRPPPTETATHPHSYRLCRGYCILKQGWCFKIC